MLRGTRFRLVTLGRLTLIGTGGEEDTSLAKRRLKLAVLAVLAIARRPVARDALIEMFWGAQDEARARHSLSNALSSLRRTLGQHAITTREADVAIAADASLDVDAIELADAADAAETARVVDLYGGPFLDGVLVDDSPSFEQWLSRHRRRLDALFVHACAPECAALARAGRWPGCAALALRWMDIEPLSADAAVCRLNALKAPGTRSALAQALEEYERLRTRLEHEFGLEPEPAVRDLADEVREQLATGVPRQAERSISPVSSPEGHSHEGQSHAGGRRVTFAVTPASLASLASGAPKRRVRAVVTVVGVAIAIGALALTMVSRRAERARGGESGATRPVIAVLPMEVRVADSSLAWLADGLPGLIAGKLAHSGDIDVVSAGRVRAVLTRGGHIGRESLDDAAARDLARRVGATLVARGAIGRDGGNLVVDLTVHDVASGRLVRTAVLTRHDALALADEAAAAFWPRRTYALVGHRWPSWRRRASRRIGSSCARSRPGRRADSASRGPRSTPPSRSTPASSPRFVNESTEP